MAEVTSRSSIAERPWGLTLADLANRGETGQLTIDVADKRYCIAFERGAIVGASSPLAADGAARIALTNHLVTSSQVTEIAKRLAAAPERDEVELIAETIELTIEQAELLRRRVIAQRAARTFAVEEGTYELGDRIRVPIIPGIHVDFRAVVFLGARLHMSDARLATELRKLGTHFTLKREAFDDLPAYGFTDVERPVLQALRDGAGLPELEATHREVDPRTLQAMIYSLATCGSVTCVTVARTPTPAQVNFRPRPPTGQPDLGRAPTALAPSRTSSPNIARTSSPNIARTSSPNIARTSSPNIARAPTPSITRTPIGGTPVARVPTSPNLPRTPTPMSPVVGRTAARPEIGRTPTPNQPVLPRTVTPNHPVVGRTPTPSRAITGRAPTPSRSITSRTPPPIDPEQAKTLAEEAFARGDRALKAEQLEPAIVELVRAVELQPNDVDYAATLAWARFCAATDKVGVAETTRKVLERAVYKSTKPAAALFYLGRVERMLGRDKEALRNFQEVLALQPMNDAAAAEIRVLEARIAANSKR